jgi:hypothetical protein
MKVYGYSMPAAVEESALALMRGRFFKSDLVEHLRAVIPAAASAKLDVPNAIADRLIQRERTAGNLKRSPSLREWPPEWQGVTQ